MTGPAYSTEEMLATMPHAVALGIALDEADVSAVRGHLDYSPRLTTLGGAMHGGALMTLADSVGAVCAFLNLPPDHSTSTLESKTNFLRGVREGTVRATARPLHVGRTSIVVQTDLYDDRGGRVAQTTQTQAVLPPRSSA
ncbi:PaaI family thioesterase [Streptomyces boncukensis]|uniref:PaaI family thioesterase n=1 Tax=Streptomyces boncukensis TaxID=2711219 RepID=A0A6G4WNM0_9ACTN|nr:PaaI family thioesterase [Streptomyces boncukensis]NGO66859.1 PaaI family thioesterase [Streptomyces boncukensis]